MFPIARLCLCLAVLTACVRTPPDDVDLTATVVRQQMAASPHPQLQAMAELVTDEQVAAFGQAHCELAEMAATPAEFLAFIDAASSNADVDQASSDWLAGLLLGAYCPEQMHRLDQAQTSTI